VSVETHSPAAPGAALAARDELVAAGCQVVLEESLAADSGELVASLRVTPSSTVALGRAVAMMRARRLPVRVRGASDDVVAPPSGGALLDLSALDRIASIDPTSLLARVEAGCSMAALETAARRAGCTLGPLLPSVRAGSVGAWLAGPTRGERGVAPSRRETAALTVTVLLRDGRIAESRAVPRSASGPDLDHLALGGGGLLCVIAAATIRLLPAADILAAAWRLRSLCDAVSALEQLCLTQAAPARARILITASGALLAAAWEGPVTARLERTRAMRQVVGEPTIEVGDPASWVRGSANHQSVELDARWQDLRAWSASEEQLQRTGSELRLMGLHAGGSFAVLTSAAATRVEDSAASAKACGARVLWPRSHRDSGDWWEAEGAGAVWARLRDALGSGGAE
jgi:FAD/FMN-containing dehydrogenase